MTVFRLASGRNCMVRIILAGLIAAGFAAAAATASAAEEFPYDHDLLLDTAPMGPAKRVPIINVAPDGSATIDLWCKTVTGRVALGDRAIRIDPGPLPEALPPYMSEGQCAAERMHADQDVLAALVQVTAWQKRGNTVTLSGGRSLRFRLSDH